MATAYLFLLFSTSCNVISGRKHRQFPHTDTSTAIKSTRRNPNGYRHRTKLPAHVANLRICLRSCYNPAGCLPASFPPHLSLKTKVTSESHHLSRQTESQSVRVFRLFSARIFLIQSSLA